MDNQNNSGNNPPQTTDPSSSIGMPPPQQPPAQTWPNPPDTSNPTLEPSMLTPDQFPQATIPAQEPPPLPNQNPTPPQEGLPPALPPISLENPTTENPMQTGSVPPPPEAPTLMPAPPMPQPETLQLNPIPPQSDLQPQTPTGNPANPANPANAAETAPTDLSHLISENPPPPNDIYAPPISAPENLVVPNAPKTTPEAVTAGKHFNLSKILIAFGVLVLLIVSGLSAYFILGIGKPSPSPTSDQTPLTNPPKQIVSPSPVSSPRETTATSAANFGDLSASASAAPKGKTALDLLKQRQSTGSGSR